MKKKLYIINIISATSIVVVLFVSFLMSIFAYMTEDFNRYDNFIRVAISQQRNEIEKGIFKSGKYPYIVFDLAGNVKSSESPFSYKTGDCVDVQEMLQYDKSFASENNNLIKESFILQKDGVTDGFVVFLIPKSEVYKNTNKQRAVNIFLPSAIGIILSALIIIIRTVYCNSYILNPLKEISTSAKGIIAGNYNLEVLRACGRTVNENEVGDLTYAFELMRDELKSKQIKEESLKKSQQELISCISHDLKTPISTIKAYGEGLRDNIAKNPEQKSEFVNIILTKTNLLIEMISELLEYSNVQLRQLEINREELYVLDYLDPLMSEIEIYVKQNGMDFSYKSNLSNMLVTIDKKRITEVIYNLVENSIKYIGNIKGKIYA